MYRGKKVSLIIPALNEEASIQLVVSELKALENGDNSQVIDQILVCDNGSSDNTAQLAAKAGAEVVYQEKPGYGRACLTAMAYLNNPDIVVFTDADHAFYAEQSLKLLDGVISGADLVIGSRTQGQCQPGALTATQIFGNRLASWLINKIWQQNVSDLGPYRAISKIALDRLQMQDQSFGWTVEMQVKAIQHQMKLVEVAVDTRRRLGVSKISGTIKGGFLAGKGILGKIARLYFMPPNGHGPKVLKGDTL